MSKRTVFRNKNRLSPRYVPQTLPHREDKIGFLLNRFDDVLVDPSQVYLRPVQIVGGVGTGKTCTTIRFGETLQEKAKEAKVNLRHIYANLKLQGGSRTILYRYLLERAAPEIRTASLSADEMLHQLVKYLSARDIYLIISLDEVEYFLRHTKEHVIYDLTRINELTSGKPCGVVGLLVVSRDTQYYSLLEKEELSTLGRDYLEFKPYTAAQIKDILLARSEEAFKKGAASSVVIDFISEIVAAPPVNGDVRYALDLLLYAGNLADSRGSEAIILDHVRGIHGEIQHVITSQDIFDLSDNEKAVLLAIARVLRGKQSAYASFEEIRNGCELVSESLKVKVGNVDYAVQDLVDRGIVEVKSLVEIGISSIPTQDLAKYLDNLVERIRSNLHDREA